MTSKQVGGIGLLAFLSFILYYYTQNPSHSMELFVQWGFGIMIVIGFIVVIVLMTTTAALQTLSKTRKLKPADVADYNKKLETMQSKPQFSNYRVLVLLWQFGLAYNLMTYGFDATAILYTMMLVLALGSEYHLRKSVKPL